MTECAVIDEITSGLLTLREAAGLLDVSKSTIERRIKAGELRAIKVGHLTKVSKNAVRDYVVNSCPPVVYR